jgi:cytochrome c5
MPRPSALRGRVMLLLTLAALGCGQRPEAEPVQPASQAETVPTWMEWDPNFDNGRAVYDRACHVCHIDAAEGIAGAAGLRDPARWRAQSAKGWSTLLEHVQQGWTGRYGTLPPRGTCADCSERDLFDAVHYMMKRAGVEPPAF